VRSRRVNASLRVSSVLLVEIGGGLIGSGLMIVTGIADELEVDVVSLADVDPVPLAVDALVGVVGGGIIAGVAAALEFVAIGFILTITKGRAPAVVALIADAGQARPKKVKTDSPI
jgi:hypothetical protein